MAPIFLTVVIALTFGAATFALLTTIDRRLSRRPATDDVPPPSRLAGTVAALVILVVLAVVLGVLSRAVEGNSPVVRWDDTVERWAADHAGPVATDVLRLITDLGATVTVVALAAVVTIALLVRGHRRLALFLVTVVVGQWAIANLTKELVRRARPALDPLASFSGFSFPSGHSTAAAATYLALALIATALWPRLPRPVTVAVAVGIATAVAASRALLGVHWFSDVIGGLVLGWSWCVVCALLYDVLRRRPSLSGSVSTTTSSPSAT
jgi:membrane-associated phospholipid phosphatase